MVDSNLDDDFQPPLLFIKRSKDIAVVLKSLFRILNSYYIGRSNTQDNYPQPKRLKDKDKSTHSD